MNAPLRATSFDAAIGEKLARPEHLRVAVLSARDRFLGAAVTLAAHLVVAVALVLGFHAAQPLVAPQTIMVAVESKQPKPEKLDVVMPKFVPPAAITAPEPVFDIAPNNPAAISAPPPRSVTPVAMPSPAPAQESGENRATYLGALLAQLNRFKQYPPQARAAHIEGVVMLHFIIDRSGRVLSAEIARSSGREALDREALALIARAQPLPAMPAEMKFATLDAIVPINFSLHPAS